jgi:homoserine dehydrogenase
MLLLILTSRLRPLVRAAIDVDYVHGEPATSYLQEALRHGVHAISANKGPVVHHRAALLSMATSSGVRYLHESAVMDGVPIFSTWRGGFLPGGARLTKFRGCLNSTSSVVLSGMEGGQSMAEALKVAQDAGIAEADPSGDLRGMDAAVKVVALAVAFELGAEPPPRPSATDFGAASASMAAAATTTTTTTTTTTSPALALSDVAISGIEHTTPAEVAEAKAAGRKLRLVGGAEVDASSGRVSGYVRVESLAPGDPLYGLEGADAAVQLFTDRLAPVTIVQSGSVVEDTAFGQYADMLRAARPMGV